MFSIDVLLRSISSNAEVMLKLLGCGSINEHGEGIYGHFSTTGQLPNYRHVRVSGLRDNIQLVEVKRAIGKLSDIPTELGEEFLKLHFNLELDKGWEIKEAFVGDETVAIIIEDDWVKTRFLFQLYLSGVGFDLDKNKAI